MAKLCLFVVYRARFINWMILSLTLIISTVLDAKLNLLLKAITIIKYKIDEHKILYDITGVYLLENELQILKNIDKDTITSQRAISKKTGISLGNVNVILKRLVNKGLVKIEGLTPKTIRYILTPKGVQERAERTYQYVVSTVKLVNEIDKNIEQVIATSMSETVKDMLLFCRRDELQELIVQKLKAVEIKCCVVHTLQELMGLVSEYEEIGEGDRPSILVLTYQPDCSKTLREKGIKYLDLMEKM